MRYARFCRQHPRLHQRVALRQHPRLHQRVALKHIASFLGITPELLSLLRAKQP